MKYQLMTGATGLLGAYLLRDSLATERRMAVLVRPSRIESGRQRIESILARFEVALGRSLPRPVVLAGDLSSPSAGLDGQSLAWVAKHCDSVLHNAASLSFYHDEKTGEPERSNIAGTRHILALCREVGIRDFHHVSTAYVCGRREGTCLESELDVGQEFGNDYEQTKVAAEKLVRAADFLDSTTFYRPAIIVGDSQTGYTSSFHGFFTPLKVASAIIQNLDSIDGSPILAALGFSEQDEKNFVPVDWVSAAMVHIMQHREHYGATYHLVPRNRVSVGTAKQVMEDAVKRRLAKRPRTRSAPAINLAASEGLFREQMGVYRSYWRNDPEFDYRNTAAAAPHLPCPRVDYEMLMRMSMYALESGFGWPLPTPLTPPCDLELEISRASTPVKTMSEPAGRVGLQISGPGGGQWTLALPDGRGVEISPGLPDGNVTTIYLNSIDGGRLVARSLSVDQAIDCGAVHVEYGDGAQAEAGAPLVRRALSCLAHQAPAPGATTGSPRTSLGEFN